MPVIKPKPGETPQQATKRQQAESAASSKARAEDGARRRAANAQRQAQVAKTNRGGFTAAPKQAAPSSATRRGNGYATPIPSSATRKGNGYATPLPSSAARQGNGYTATMSAKPATPTAPRSTPRVAPVASPAQPARTTAARPSGTSSDLRARRTVATAPPAQAVAAAVPPAIPYSSPYVQPQLTRQPLFDISGNYIGPVGTGATSAPATPAAAAISAAFDPEAYRQALMSQFDGGQYIAPVAGNPNTVINAQGIPTVQRTRAEAALLPLRSATATQLASPEYRQLLEELLNEARARGEL